MRYSTIAAVLVVIVSLPLNAQKIDNSSLFENKNSISVSGGFGGIYLSAHLNYERILKTKKDHVKYRQLGLKVGYNRWVLWADNGSTYYSSMNWIWGKSNNHLETSLGLSILFESSMYELEVSNYRVNYGVSGNEPTWIQYILPIPSGNIGYRFQKPDGHFIFRTGIGWPEALYIGFGVSF